MAVDDEDEDAAAEPSAVSEARGGASPAAVVEVAARLSLVEPGAVDVSELSIKYQQSLKNRTNGNRTRIRMQHTCRYVCLYYK